MKRLLSSALILTLIFTLFSCNSSYTVLQNRIVDSGIVTVNVKLSDQGYTVTNTFSFHQPIVKVILNIYSGTERILSKEFEDPSTINVQIPKGQYDFEVFGYITNNRLYITGRKNINITSNTQVVIDTELVPGTIDFLIVPIAQSQNENFEIVQATTTLINQLSKQVVVLSKFEHSYQSGRANFQKSLKPGLWCVKSEVLAKKLADSNDIRYSQTNQQILYIEPSQTLKAKASVTVPRTEEIGILKLISSVHDGDTFKDINNNDYRIIGIDTPEVQAGTKPVGEYSQEAKLFLENFVAKGQSYIRVLIKGTDTYGRALAYVFDRYGKQFYEEEISKLGYARPLFYSDNEVQALTSKIIDGYRYAYQQRNGIFSKWPTASVITKETTNKDNYVGKIVWLKGLVTSVTSDSTKYTITLDDGWGKIEIRKEEFSRLFQNSLNSLNNRTVKFYGELWKESGIFKILLRAEFEYVFED